MPIAASRFGHPRRRRLRARREFLDIQSRGLRIVSPHFVLLVAATRVDGVRDVPPARLGVTVTRKIGDSVRRNRVRRLVREAFRLVPTLLPAGVDLLVIARDGAPDLTLAEVQAEWERLRVPLQRRAHEALTAGAK